MAQSSEIFDLFRQSSRIAEIRELEALLLQATQWLVRLSQGEAGALYLLDHDTQELALRAVHGLPDAARLLGKRIELEKVGQEKLGLKRIKLSANGGTQWLIDTWQCKLEIRNTLLIPLAAEGKTFGFLQVFNVGSPELDLVEIAAQRVSLDIHRALGAARAQKRIERLETLIANFEKIVSNLDRDQLLSVIIDSASKLLDAESSSIFLLDPENPSCGDLILYMASNLKPGAEKPRVPSGKGIIGHVVQTGETVISNNARQDKRHYAGIDRQTGFVTRSLLAVPLRTHQIVLGSERGIIQQRIIGGLEAFNKRSGVFTQEDAETLQIFANQAGTILEITKLYADANNLFLDAIKAFTTAIDAKDPYTEDHSQRVSEYSVAIARELGLDGEMIHRVRLSGLLHDIGKITIPSVILTKATRLTNEEFELIKTHPEIGARIVSEIRMLSKESSALSEHHERLDGSGYPKGLSGGEISLTAQIISVADVFDAMTSDRTYRKALPVEDVFRYLRSETQMHFDVRCVEALIAAYRKGEILTEHDENRLRKNQTEDV